ncbi:MAG: aldo/keto reductase [Saprospiraceae bacterium]|nr:aldo/keto reductase [Saprospiraceae bacterium]
MDNPDLILGTALWGWTIDQDACFQLLDNFYESGFRQIDCATNYPINQDPHAFRKAEHILKEWIRAHRVSDLRLLIKVGSLNNLGGAENNLSRSFLLMNLADYQEAFGANLETFMIHWDNRDSEAAVAESMEALQLAHQQGLTPGLSGIRHPEIYAALNQTFLLPFRIQIKHNILQSAFAHYQSFHGKAEFLTYGTNAGGLKLNRVYRKESSIQVRNIAPDLLLNIQHKLEEILKSSTDNGRPPLAHFFQLGMLFSYYLDQVTGILIGPSNADQLKENIRCWSLLQSVDYRDLYQKLRLLEIPA